VLRWALLRRLIVVGAALLTLTGGLMACSSTAARTSATVPRHVPTWAFDDAARPGTCNGGLGAHAGLVRRWVTYAETNCGAGARKANRDCHSGRRTYCLTLAYIDPNLVWSVGGLRLHGACGERAWLHLAGATIAPQTRIGWRAPSDGVGFELDQANRCVRAWVGDYVRRHYSAWNGLMVDDTAATLPEQLYGTGSPAYRSSSEIKTNAALLSAHREMAIALGARRLQVDNGLAVNPYERPGLDLLNATVGVRGLIAEGFPWSQGQLSPYYPTGLDEIAYVDTRLARKHDFIVLLSYATDGRQQARLVQEATMMLGFAPGQLVDWADLERNSLRLAVWPEEGLYPTRPLESMRAPGGPGCLAGTGLLCSRGGHNSLRVAGAGGAQAPGSGVYRREFARCYYLSRPIGGCAALVNDTGAPVTVQSRWLHRSYRYVIGLVGGDVQSGGRLDLRAAPFRPGVTSIAPDSALLLAAD
jgi:hypothetical protein